MKLLFLDCDGVLNSENWAKAGRPNIILPRSSIGIDELAFMRLKRIIEATNAMIVVSSSWRKNERELNSLFELLEKYNMLNGRHATPDSKDGVRGGEIQKWLDKHQYLQIEKFAILDDDDDMLHLTPHLFQTTWANGLTNEIADRVIKYLND